MGFGYNDESWINPDENEPAARCTAACKDYRECPNGCGDVYCLRFDEWAIADEVCLGE